MCRSIRFYHFIAISCLWLLLAQNTGANLISKHFGNFRSGSVFIPAFKWGKNACVKLEDYNTFPIITKDDSVQFYASLSVLRRKQVHEVQNVFTWFSRENDGTINICATAETNPDNDEAPTGSVGTMLYPTVQFTASSDELDMPITGNPNKGNSNNIITAPQTSISASQKSGYLVQWVAIEAPLFYSMLSGTIIANSVIGCNGECNEWDTQVYCVEESFPYAFVQNPIILYSVMRNSKYNPVRVWTSEISNTKFKLCMISKYSSISPVTISWIAFDETVNENSSFWGEREENTFLFGKYRFSSQSEKLCHYIPFNKNFVFTPRLLASISISNDSQTGSDYVDYFFSTINNSGFQICTYTPHEKLTFGTISYLAISEYDLEDFNFVNNRSLIVFNISITNLQIDAFQSEYEKNPLTLFRFLSVIFGIFIPRLNVETLEYTDDAVNARFEISGRLLDSEADINQIILNYRQFVESKQLYESTFLARPYSEMFRKNNSPTIPDVMLYKTSDSNCIVSEWNIGTCTQSICDPLIPDGGVRDIWRTVQSTGTTRTCPSIQRREACNVPPCTVAAAFSALPTGTSYETFIMGHPVCEIGNDECFIGCPGACKV